MTYVADWPIKVWLIEDGDRTVARAVLNTRDNTLRAEGVAKRNPHDPSVPEIGDEFAVGRALSELGRQLLTSGADDVAALQHTH